MRLHVISDLHMEYEMSTLRAHSAPEGTDVVVLAGDAHPGVLGVMWAAERFSGLPVLYVPGNHEYYGKRGYHRHLTRMQNKATALGGNVRVMDREAAVIDGVRFLCATLWTDYSLHGQCEQSMLDASLLMNDYKHITGDNNHSQPIRPAALLFEHNRSVAWLRESMAREHDGPTVVVSHHAPSPRSVQAKHVGEAYTPCYASDLEWLMVEGRPDVWIHGHIHCHQDYQVGDTRVVANPRGWVSKQMGPNGTRERENEAFDPCFLLDIPLSPRYYFT